MQITRALPEAAHQQLLKSLRYYYLIGVMPEAVLAFTEEDSFAGVGDVHRSITATYQDNYLKYVKQRDLLLLQKVFNIVPRMLGNKTH